MSEAWTESVRAGRALSDTVVFSTFPDPESGPRDRLSGLATSQIPGSTGRGFCNWRHTCSAKGRMRIASGILWTAWVIAASTRSRTRGRSRTSSNRTLKAVSSHGLTHLSSHGRGRNWTFPSSFQESVPRSVNSTAGKGSSAASPHDAIPNAIPGPTREPPAEKATRATAWNWSPSMPRSRLSNWARWRNSTPTSGAKGTLASVTLRCTTPWESGLGRFSRTRSRAKSRSTSTGRFRTEEGAGGMAASSGRGGGGGAPGCCAAHPARKASRGRIRGTDLPDRTGIPGQGQRNSIESKNSPRWPCAFSDPRVFARQGADHGLQV